MPVPTGADHFDFNIKPHYHVRCTKCGGVLMYLCRLSPISSTAWRIPPAWSCIGTKFCSRVFAAHAGKTKKSSQNGLTVKRDRKNRKNGERITIMAELMGTRTEANLQTAFAGESMARNKYTFFCLQGEKGRLCADCENLRGDRCKREEHAKIWFKLLNGGIDDTTAANLKAAAEGENYEWTDYATFAKRGA